MAAVSILFLVVPNHADRHRISILLCNPFKFLAQCCTYTLFPLRGMHTHKVDVCVILSSPELVAANNTDNIPGWAGWATMIFCYQIIGMLTSKTFPYPLIYTISPHAEGRVKLIVYNFDEPAERIVIFLPGLSYLNIRH